jgi:large subunit ribosomal protein L37Ae
MLMGKTRVVGIAGRFGVRYGATLRKKVKEVLEKRYSDHTCPFCGHKGRVFRVSTGLWTCRKCGAKWAGGSYVPRTGVSKTFPEIIIRE